MCLAFPDVYEIGMSHLGFRILYEIINANPLSLADRAYAPWEDMSEQLRKHDEPLRSLESARGLSEFDVVGFSFQFELTFTNVLLMLDLSQIPLRSHNRTMEHPLIIAGGPTATHPEPMAPFIDAFVIGDGEEVALQILQTWSRLKKGYKNRTEALREIAALPGVYVPSFYDLRVEPLTGMQVVSSSDPSLPFPIKRAFVEDINRFPFPSTGPVAATETTFDRVSVEIARGCTEGCRFCQAGMIYRPVRERDPESILQSLMQAVDQGGYDEASLTCLSTADYSAINPLVKKVAKHIEGKNISLSVSSLRAYGLDESILDDIKKVRAGGLTFAPEAGSQRMRDVVNKNVTEEQLLTTADRVFARGWKKMKLYFMIGLPTEEEEDVRGIIRTAVKAWQEGRKHMRGAEVTASVSIHVPKPHTPFQWCAMDSRDDSRKKQSWLKDEVRRTKVSLRMHDSDASWLEGILARGDRKLGDVIEHAYRNGATFDSWDEKHRPETWHKALEACNITPSEYLRTIPTKAVLPWSHIDVGLEEGFLEKEYRKSLQSRLSPPCGKVAGMFVHHTSSADAENDQKKLVCYDCGVACDLGGMRDERLVYLRKLEAPEAMAVQPEMDSTLPTTRYLFEYEKLGPAVFRGHLDLVRLFPRILKRSKIPVRITQGFHPMPDVIYGPALSLGSSSLDEKLELRIHGDFQSDALLHALNRAAEPGIRFTSCVKLSPQTSTLMKRIRGAVYTGGIARSTLAGLGIDSEEALKDRIHQRMQSEMVVRRTIKGIGKNINIHDFIVGVESGFKGSMALEQGGIMGDLAWVRFELKISNDGAAKPSEVLSSLIAPEIGQDVFAHWVREQTLLTD